MSGQLVLHNPKFDAKLVNHDALRQLPEPMALGLRHKPVPHFRLVDAVLAEVDRRGFDVERQQLALSQKGDALFGVLDLLQRGDQALTTHAGRGISFGFRTSVNSTLAIKAVAGTRVFVCDNLALSGQMIAIQRKSTTGLDLTQAIAGGFDKFVVQVRQLDVLITGMEQLAISDDHAKVLAFDWVTEGIIPCRLLDDVRQNYFAPTNEMADCQPRTLWGLHNAVTRAIRDLTPVRGFNASTALGKACEAIVEQAA